MLPRSNASIISKCAPIWYGRINTGQAQGQEIKSWLAPVQENVLTPVDSRILNPHIHLQRGILGKNWSTEASTQSSCVIKSSGSWTPRSLVSHWSWVPCPRTALRVPFTEHFHAGLPVLAQGTGAAGEGGWQGMLCNWKRILIHTSFFSARWPGYI